jgi:cytochrome c
MMQGKSGRHQRPPARADGRRLAHVLLALAGVLAIAHAAPSRAAGDAARGAKVYQDCMICHALDQNEIGPRHRDVFGRKAGSVAGYDYSAALKASSIVWDAATLDKWLTDPPALVPGTKMMFSVDDAQDRADVIAFLKAARNDPGTTAGAK